MEGNEDAKQAGCNLQATNGTLVELITMNYASYSDKYRFAIIYVYDSMTMVYEYAPKIQFVCCGADNGLWDTPPLL